jgi:hypothetical protein
VGKTLHYFNYCFALILVPLLLVDCSCFKKSINIKNIVLELPLNVPNIDRTSLAQVVEEAVNENLEYRYIPDSFDGEELNIIIMASNNALESALMMVALSNGNNQSEYSSFAEINLTDGNVSFTDIKKLLVKLLKNIYLMRQGKRVEDYVYLDDINAYLAGGEIREAQLINAISVLGETESQKAVDPIINVLANTHDIAVGNACMMALGRLKDPKGMQAIIDYTERKPSLVRRQGIMAAREIGTKLALEWLLVMAYGHEDATVRKEALEALSEVEKKLGI